MATVSGYVEKIKYRNEENGYSILNVSADGLDYVLVGTFPYISEGDFIEATGRDVEHPAVGERLWQRVSCAGLRQIRSASLKKSRNVWQR